MAQIRLVDHKLDIVKQEEVPVNKASLKPLPREIRNDEKIYRFYGYDNKVAVYKEV